MTASSSVVLSNIAYLVGAVVLAIIGGLIVWLRHRKPKSVDANVESFHRGLRALAPDGTGGPPTRTPGGSRGVRIRPTPVGWPQTLGPEIGEQVPPAAPEAHRPTEPKAAPEPMAAPQPQAPQPQALALEGGTEPEEAPESKTARPEPAAPDLAGSDPAGPDPAGPLPQDLLSIVELSLRNPEETAHPGAAEDAGYRAGAEAG